ncbi:hypothetical protein TIFTF001_024726 [Ficus carica]|uniref:WAT1-related protein n=1 Tax=Ficus carica TaxID=3494 RepID=A0AA88DDK9_FICCA|nr:hypothetical protein TIFTF001_024726 [Ficus carica]
MEKLSNFLEVSKPYFAMISLQFGYAGMNIITKVSLNHGMSHYVLVVYRHAIATAVIAPFAIFFERKAQPKITLPVFMQIFTLALLGPVIDQNFYYAGLKFTSPTFSCAMSNMLPAMTFVMAVLCRMESIDMKKVRCQAKVVGTAVTVAGAMLMTLYKGRIVEMVWSKHVHPRKSYITDTTGTGDKHWFIGSIFLIIATLAWASFFVLQELFRPLQSPLLWNTKPLPLMMIIVAIMGSFILAEKIYLGGVLGAVLIVIGLYSVLWGKHKEGIENKEKEIPEAIKGAQVNNINGSISVIEDIEANGNNDLKKADLQITNKNKFIMASVAISMSIQDPSKANQEPKA